MKFEKMVKLVSKHLRDIEGVRSLVPHDLEDSSYMEIRDDFTRELFQCLPRKVVEVFEELTECGESLCEEFPWALNFLDDNSDIRDPACYFRHREPQSPWQDEVDAATKVLKAEYPRKWRCDAQGPASRARIVIDKDGKHHITNN